MAFPPKAWRVPFFVLVTFVLVVYQQFRLHTCVAIEDTNSINAPPPQSVTAKDGPQRETVKPARADHINRGPACHIETLLNENSLGATNPVTDEDNKCHHLPSFHHTPELKFGCDEIRHMHRGEMLGEGYWREVFETTYKGEKYVIKRMKDGHKVSSRNVERHRIEALIGEAIGSHPNAVEVVGYCDTTVVTAWQPYYLDVMLFDDYTILDSVTMVTYALDIATGLSVFHEALGGTATHTDLQPRQFLIGFDGRVKINDYNRAKITRLRPNGCPCGFEISKSNGKWRAPEEYLFQTLNQPLDVYSMAMIFYSLVANEKPFAEHENAWVYKNVVLGARPRVPDRAPEEFARLIEECWHMEPHLRPTSAQVVERLQKLLEQLKAKEKA